MTCASRFVVLVDRVSRRSERCGLEILTCKDLDDLDDRGVCSFPNLLRGPISRVGSMIDAPESCNFETR